MQRAATPHATCSGNERRATVVARRAPTAHRHHGEAQPVQHRQCRRARDAVHRHVACCMLHVVPALYVAFAFRAVHRRGFGGCDFKRQTRERAKTARRAQTCSKVEQRANPPMRQSTDAAFHQCNRRRRTHGISRARHDRRQVCDVTPLQRISHAEHTRCSMTCVQRNARGLSRVTSIFRTGFATNHTQVRGGRVQDARGVRRDERGSYACA